MGHLPTYRVQQIKTFGVTGVDYAGPIYTKAPSRRAPATKSYICLFVCMVTKALHLELCSDLSTEIFLLAFSRFVCRRGPVKEVHSDNGTNFVGAAELLKLVYSEEYSSAVGKHLAAKSITWHFNPPSSPHFGGLWEAGVKSVKTLLLLSIGLHILSYEELYSVLVRIEATLNSRPLCSLSEDPLSLEALTPGHFLNMEPTTSLPDPHLEQVSLSKLKRWRLTADIYRHFWNRWHNEYISSLQTRSKWKQV